MSLLFVGVSRSPLISLSFPFHLPVVLYTSYKAHINLIQGSYELNDAFLKKRKCVEAPDFLAF